MNRKEPRRERVAIVRQHRATAEKAEPIAGNLDVDAVERRAREVLSGYKVPTRWVIVAADQIPTLTSGKFDRKSLRSKVTDGTLGSAAVADM